METLDPRERWGRWLLFNDGPLSRDVLRMTHRMNVYRRFMEICRDAPEQVAESGGEFLGWVRANYAEAQLAGIRRQGGRPGANSISLRRLLAEMHDYTIDQEQRSRIDADREALIGATKLACARATTTVAHILDPKRYTDDARAAEGITFDEVHECVDLIGRLYSHYAYLVLGERPHLDNWIMEPWDYAFRFAWVTDES